MIASIELQHTFLQLETFRFLRNVFSAYFFAISPQKHSQHHPLFIIIYLGNHKLIVPLSMLSACVTQERAMHSR